MDGTWDWILQWRCLSGTGCVNRRVQENLDERRRRGWAGRGGGKFFRLELRIILCPSCRFWSHPPVFSSSVRRRTVELVGLCGSVISFFRNPSELKIICHPPPHASLGSEGRSQWERRRLNFIMTACDQGAGEGLGAVGCRGCGTET